MFSQANNDEHITSGQPESLKLENKSVEIIVVKILDRIFKPQNCSKPISLPFISPENIVDISSLVDYFNKINTHTGPLYVQDALYDFFQFMSCYLFGNNDSAITLGLRFPLTPFPPNPIHTSPTIFIKSLAAFYSLKEFSFLPKVGEEYSYALIRNRLIANIIAAMCEWELAIRCLMNNFPITKIFKHINFSFQSFHKPPQIPLPLPDRNSKHFLNSVERNMLTNLERKDCQYNSDIYFDAEWLDAECHNAKLFNNQCFNNCRYNINREPASPSPQESPLFLYASPTLPPSPADSLTLSPSPIIPGQIVAYTPSIPPIGMQEQTSIGIPGGSYLPQPNPKYPKQAKPILEEHISPYSTTSPVAQSPFPQQQHSPHLAQPDNTYSNPDIPSSPIHPPISTEVTTTQPASDTTTPVDSPSALSPYVDAGIVVYQNSVGTQNISEDTLRRGIPSEKLNPPNPHNPEGFNSVFGRINR